MHKMVPPTSSLWLFIVQQQDRSEFKLCRKGLILISLQALYPANTQPCV